MNSNPLKVQRNAAIAQDRLSIGMTYRELAEKYELNSGQISRILNDSEIRDVIETGTRQLVARVPLAISRFDDILNDTESPHHYKAIQDNLKATGIFPSHASSVTINSIIYQDNRSAISPEIQQIMQHQLDQQTIEDGEYEVIDNQVDSNSGVIDV